MGKWPPELPPCQGFLLFFVMCHAICIFFNLAGYSVSEKIAKIKSPSDVSPEVTKSIIGM